MTTIATMTLDDLKQFVQETVDERLTNMLGKLDVNETSMDENLTWEEIRSLANTYRWTPPANAKTSLELLREDRDN